MTPDGLAARENVQRLFEAALSTLTRRQRRHPMGVVLALTEDPAIMAAYREALAAHDAEQLDAFTFYAADCIAEYSLISAVAMLDHQRDGGNEYAAGILDVMSRFGMIGPV